MAKCKFCNKEIVWTKEGRKNVPINDDGSTHRCDEMKKTIDSTKSIIRSDLSQDEISKYEQAINIAPSKRK